MKKMLLLCGALLVVSAAAAFAAQSSDGLGLNWDGCAGPNFKTSTCTSNSGVNHLALSYTSAAGMPGYIGLIGQIDVATDGVLPAWWGNGCTGKTGTNMFSVAGTPANLPAGCDNDSYNGNTAGGGLTAVRFGWHGTNTVQCEFALANAQGSEVDLAAATQYFLCDMTISNAKSVGATCAGCLTSACISFGQAKIDALSLANTLVVTATDGPWISWQGNPATPSSCVGATPTHNSTWGSVKALYR
jgi:hypothetical protein